MARDAHSVVWHCAKTCQAAHLFGKVDLLAHICQGNLLRGGHNDSAIHIRILEELGDGDVLVGCARRGVYDQVIQISPVNVLQQAADMRLQCLCVCWLQACRGQHEEEA